MPYGRLDFPVVCALPQAKPTVGEPGSQGLAIRRKSQARDSALGVDRCDRLVRFQVWELESHKPITTIDAERGVTGLAFSPDGQTLAAGFADGRLGLWESTNYGEVEAPVWHPHKISGPGCSPA